METFKTSVKFIVFAFVLAAGAISVAGLDSASKAEALALATDKPSVEAPDITTKKAMISKQDLAQAELVNAR